MTSIPQQIFPHKPFLEQLGLIETVAAYRPRVLLVGETGTGKTKLARQLHDLAVTRGWRDQEKWSHVNVAALPDYRLEGELFGWAKGAFPDAKEAYVGALERANGGTVLLDEVGHVPPYVQAKLLTVIETGLICPLGGEPKMINVWFLSATAEPQRLLPELEARLSQVVIELPPLRERKPELKELAEAILNDQLRLLKKHNRILSDEVLSALEKRAWPANVRELEGLMYRLALLSPPTEADPITAREIARADSLAVRSKRTSTCVESIKLTLRTTRVGDLPSMTELKKAIAESYLELFPKKKKDAADKLRVKDPRTLDRWLREEEEE